MSDLIVAAPAAGWYPDPIADGQLRWWNGEGWTERTTAPEPEPTPIVAPTAIVAPAAPAPAAPADQVDYAAALQTYAPEPAAAPSLAFSAVSEAGAFDWQQTPLPSRDSALGYSAAAEHTLPWRPSKTATAGAWGLAFLPWTSAALGVAGRFATGYATVAPYVPAAIGIIILLLAVALAQRDKRRLLDLGHERPASEWWVLLAPPLAYLVARTVSVHRNSGKGIAPLVGYLVNCVLVVAAGVGVAIVLPVLLG